MVVGIWATGCISPRLVAPLTVPAAPTEATPVFGNLDLQICDFQISGRSIEERPRAEEQLQEAFRSYLFYSAPYRSWQRCPPTPQQSHEVRLDVQVTVALDNARTYLLDILFFYPFLGTFPLTPEWGDAVVTMKVRPQAPGLTLAPIEVDARAAYSMFVYSWYRTDPVEKAFQRAFQRAFYLVGQQLASHLKPHALAMAGAPKVIAVQTSSVAPPVNDFDDWDKEVTEVLILTPGLPLQAEPLVSLTWEEMPAVEAPLVPPPVSPAVPPPVVLAGPVGFENRSDGGVVRLEEEGVRIIVRPLDLPQDASDGLFLRYLRSLGGIELSRTGGLAKVSSRTLVDGVSETVASGEARSSGYRLSLYSPPDRTGFFFPPRVGFFSQNITISGFREDLPVFQSGNGLDIPALASDPDTGVPVDINEPVAYALRLKSGYVGQGVGFNFVWGDESWQSFSTLSGSVSFVELRHSDVAINTSRVKGTSWAFVQSGQFTAQSGLMFPGLHLGIRTLLEFEWFRDFDYPQAVEFLAASRYNIEKQIVERQRVFVQGASLWTLNWQISAILFF